MKTRMRPGPLHIISSILLCLLIISCNSSPDKAGAIKANKEIAFPAAVPTMKEISIIDTIIAGEKDTLIVISNGEAILKGHIIAHGRQPVYSMRVSRGDSVIAIVRPLEKKGNVRISQVQEPGGSFDGPFGDSLHYVTKRNGTLRLVIGQNMMAGDAWTGDFILHVWRK